MRNTARACNFWVCGECAVAHGTTYSSSVLIVFAQKKISRDHALVQTAQLRDC